VLTPPLGTLVKSNPSHEKMKIIYWLTNIYIKKLIQLPDTTVFRYIFIYFLVSFSDVLKWLITLASALFAAALALSVRFAANRRRCFVLRFSLIFND
jgi:hypothetical protein